MFGDENRQTFLWVHGIDKFVLDLLTSSDSSEKLKKIENKLIDSREQLKKLEDSKRKLVLEGSQKQSLVQLMRNDIGKNRALGNW